MFVLWMFVANPDAGIDAVFFWAGGDDADWAQALLALLLQFALEDGLGELKLHVPIGLLGVVDLVEDKLVRRFCAVIDEQRGPGFAGTHLRYARAHLRGTQVEGEFGLFGARNEIYHDAGLREDRMGACLNIRGAPLVWGDVFLELGFDKFELSLPTRELAFGRNVRAYLQQLIAGP